MGSRVAPSYGLGAQTLWGLHSSSPFRSNAYRQVFPLLERYHLYNGDHNVLIFHQEVVGIKYEKTCSLLSTAPDTRFRAK